MTQTTTSAQTLPFSFYSQNAGESLIIARQLYKKKFGSWAFCLKCAWRKLRALKQGTVEFIKVGDATKRVANIAPIGDYTGYQDFDPKFPGLFKCIDVDKLKTEKEPKMAIISMYLQNIVDTPKPKRDRKKVAQTV